MNNKKKGLILSILGILGLIIITTGVTYAFFNYAKEGTTENSITTGTITFLYTEVSGVGRGISIDDAYPISDEVGMAQTGEGKVFDFKVTSTTSNKSSISYEVTARKKDTSTLDEDVVKLYLTKVTGDVEEEVLLANYDSLTQTTKVDSSKYIEKTIYTGKVPADSTNYEQNFRLRMWIDEDTSFSPVVDENGEYTYPYNDKEFTITVNVYANAKVVTEEDIENESKAEINTLTVDGEELTAVEGQDYDYEITLPEGTTSTTINVETISEYASVNVEKIDSLAYSNSSVKRLSASKTLDLNPGDNYFKITVTSENNEVENEYKIKITVKQGEILLSAAIFNKYTTIYENPTLTTSSNNTEDASGLYKSTATNSSEATYYFRGEVENNYVDFAGFTWRIVRINEDGTIRLIMQDGINNNTTYHFNTSYSSADAVYMYYSYNSNAKTQLETWYTNNIASNSNYASKIATGNYFCEEARVKYKETYKSGSATMTLYSSYTPNFKCTTDGNGYGIVNSNIGLITYDELVYAGAYPDKNNSSYYLYNSGNYIWTMSPAGNYGGYNAHVWYTGNNDSFKSSRVNRENSDHGEVFRPVINLKADTTVTGTGASDDHWVVQ